jgi:SAM-dependent methyltransferase
LSVEETFETVYAKQLWGGEGSHQFYSGGGSDIEYAGRYCEFVRQFIRDREIKSVVDVGCGDFRVGRNLLVPGTSYTGIDVAQTLIDRNTREFSREEVKFVAINAIEQVPPSANLCLIRQVLQHLSNAQILDILRNCRSFRYLLVSDHLFPNHPGPFNVDKPHGPDTRESGIRLDLPPFKMETQIMLEVEVGQGEMIRTVLIERKLA